MKTFIFFIVALFLGVAVSAQAPQSFRYQAVARDNSGNVLANQNVSFRISILGGSISGTVVYSETHSGLSTNAFSLVELEIGKGTPVTGTFSAINWGSNSYFVKIEMDPEGGTAYQELSTSQLLSVPYALHAKTVETGDNWGNQVVIPDNTLSGNGTVKSPLKLADNGVTSVHIENKTVATEDLADNAVTSGKLATGSVISAKIATDAVTGDKISQSGATSGQVLKWNGTTWAPAADAIGSSSGWTDDGSIIRLTTSTDSVQLGSVSRLGKLNIGGNIGLNLLSSIYFGSDATRITGLTGGDLRLVAEDLSMLTTEDITFGHYGDETWIKFDNANKRVGIGTLIPADKLHVVQNATTAGSTAIKGVATPTTGLNYGVYGESLSASGYGMYGKSPKYGVYGTATGNQGRGVVGEATGTASIGVQGIAANTSSTGVWGEGSNQGVYGFSSSTTGKGVYGKVTSADGYSGYFEGGKFYVKGNAEIRDTLFADALQIANSPRVAYEKFSLSRTISTLNSWGPMDTITIVAPGPGFVMLNFSGTLYTNHTYLEGTWVGVGISTSPTSGILAQVWWEFEHQLIGGYYQSPCAVNAVATVSAAGTKKFYIVSYHWGTSADEDVVYLNYGSFSALFIPSP
ncbi:MAG TPA: hypothetical protein VLQ91_03105 [Draconibacterium sp.]|nr:hypothetical protein [Draconibacterium sp.]